MLNDVDSGTPFFVPALWMFEVAHALLVLRRLRRLDAQQYDRARRAIGKLYPVVDEQGCRLALGEVSALAEKHMLSVYDAAYLELALRKSVPLATGYSALNRAARREGVPTEFPTRPDS